MLNSSIYIVKSGQIGAFVKVFFIVVLNLNFEKTTFLFFTNPMCAQYVSISSLSNVL